MSWTDVFPVFTDDQLSTYHSSVSPEEAALLRDWCEVAETFNPRPARHIVSASLFWKNCGKDEPELPPITRETLVNARDLGLVSRFAPWEHYVPATHRWRAHAPGFPPGHRRPDVGDKSAAWLAGCAGDPDPQRHQISAPPIPDGGRTARASRFTTTLARASSMPLPPSILPPPGLLSVRVFPPVTAKPPRSRSRGTARSDSPARLI
jgi:hypothetical protein